MPQRSPRTQRTPFSNWSPSEQAIGPQRKISGSGWGGLAQSRRGQGMQDCRCFSLHLPWSSDSESLKIWLGSGNGPQPTPWPSRKRHRVLCGRRPGWGGGRWGRRSLFGRPLARSSRSGGTVEVDPSWVENLHYPASTHSGPLTSSPDGRKFGLECSSPDVHYPATAPVLSVPFVLCRA